MSPITTSATPQTVIIGGGVYGCAAAWHLAAAGHDVLLLEARTVASGASGGFGKRGVRANRRDLRELPLMREAYRAWPALADRLGADVGYERTGGLHLIEQETTGTRGGLVAAAVHAQVQSGFGVPTRVLDRAQLRELEPDVGEQVHAALSCPLDGIADHEATTRAYADAARRLGATVLENSPVRRLEREGERVVAVHTDTQRHAVRETVLVLNNSAAPELVDDQLGVSLPVWRILPQALLVRPDGKPPVRHLVGHDHRSLSLKVVPGDRVMVSGGWRGHWDGAQGRGELVEANVEGNLRAAAEVYPSLAGAELECADASRPESCSADQVPVMDVVPGAPNVFVGTGWTGHGFAIAPTVSAALALWVRTGRRPDVLAPFALDRFSGPSEPGSPDPASP